VNGVIICIGNRFVKEDATGLAVLACLKTMQPISGQITLVEGGLAGLNLLPLLEQGGRVVFVDAVRGFAQPDEIVLFNHQEIINTLTDSYFDHGAGLAYLLTVLPKVYDGDLPEEIVLVGLEGECSAETIKRAAKLSLTIAVDGLKDVR
jgi:hydrogenase maturation protease